MLSSRSSHVRFDWVRRPDGTSEFEDYLLTMDPASRSATLAKIQQIEELGLSVAMRKEWVKKLENDLYEIRIRVKGNQYRSLYFHAYDNMYLITHTFMKKTQKTPKKELSHARAVRAAWKGRQ
ncbi:type II toxin-antitoxin system RelE/ParE family toxin [Bifidobacterium choloepi]|uniref:Type II toxin-antitoxin system RelE/ParE family toxin n=1 Tax=Bifidobacterium choloepi TaxID=2614131 RepID=A0A6I5NB85_9BIFI|nr:type II toxin-antitoxin system RelE/ParE family toxin [Bifidobacterium choloepi]NEG69740.1 type II toxin-antitoxin system RelE/ParE family toxin [Bifidobacterium choloepi]